MNNTSILIVDDDTVVLDILKEILTPNYTVYFAKSGKEAIKRAIQNKPDLILLDVVMPDMDGFDVISKLKNSDITRNIPVIFITGMNQVEDEEKGFHSGAVDYITKPFHASIVRARIQSHLHTSGQLRPKDSASIMVKTKQELRNILLCELIYISVSGHWVSFHLTDSETITIYSSLLKFEEQLLRDPRFIHCHKSFIINMDYIMSIEGRSILMQNNDLLPISKKYMDLKKRFIG